MSLKSKLLLLLMHFYAILCVLQSMQTTNAATEYNRYLAHLFQKYGNGGTMTFEGLEHLMFSLGLGQIEFDPEHTIDKHRPEGFDKETTGKENDAALKSYFEQQTKNLLYIEENTENHSTTKNDPKMLTLGKQNAPDISSPSQSMNDKGIILEFKEMHDPKHRHPRENDATFDGPPLTSSNVCLSPKSLLRLVVDHNDLHKSKLYQTLFSGSAQDAHNYEEEYNEFINSFRLTPLTFMKLCPALLAQIDQHVCIQPAPLTHGEDPKGQLFDAWIYATGTIFVLSVCGLSGILLVPLMKSMAYQEILKFLVAIAVGTLSGDALMHLLPHALMQEHDEPAMQLTKHNSNEHHGHDNRAVLLCGCSFAVALLMFIIENVIPLLKGKTGLTSHGHSHAVGHNHAAGKQKAADTTAAAQELPSMTVDVKDVMEINIMLNETKPDRKTASPPLTPVAFMVVLGDGLHNLTDGLAIGAAFASGPVTGLATAFAVLCHELPHELGDFALLLQTGVSMQRAVFLNLVSSVLSFIGMAIGLSIAGLHESMTQWIYAGTAGSFLYIAFADLLPAMAADSERTLKVILIQIVGIALGGLIMLTIAVNEDDLESLFK